ncbi:uncharacterized protein LOC134528471 [Bacillus rossius redtenbacheri]|uniref:uncharacterized protein LOC134528471 n=1 Tax=Bacillus rossius redtenbacheri TaxID=93214 RepID=UPI002FDECDA2
MMSERNPRKRKSTSEGEDASNTKRNKTKNAARSLQSSAPAPRRLEHVCPYNLRSHAHARTAGVVTLPGVSSQARASERDAQAERCTICLSEFDTQQVGTPGSCNHSFCLKCLEKWAKESNTCPVGRQKFTHICVRNELNGQVVRKVEVKAPREAVMGFHMTHNLGSVHELQISISRRVDGHHAHNQEHLMMYDAAAALAIVFTPML